MYAMEVSMTEKMNKPDVAGLFDPGCLPLEANVVLAAAAMNATELSRIQRLGKLTIPAGKSAWLEVGGVVLAEGRIEQNKDGATFVVTRMLAHVEDAS
jgi:hypothetical protein